MASTVTTPSRPVSAGCHRRSPRRSAPVVLSLGGGPRRRTPSSTSCSALASPAKQGTAKLPPPQPTASRTAAADAERERERTDYNEVAAALESIYKLSPAVVEEKDADEEDEKSKQTKRKRKGRVVSILASLLLNHIERMDSRFLARSILIVHAYGCHRRGGAGTRR